MKGLNQKAITGAFFTAVAVGAVIGAALVIAYNVFA